MSRAPTIGIGVVGFGWMGQAHSRGYRRIPMLLPRPRGEPELVVCSDTVAARRDDGRRRLRLRHGHRRLARASSTHPDVDVVVVTAPNMLHVEIVEAAAAAGKQSSARSRSAARRRRPSPPSGGRARRASSPASATTTAGRRSCSTPRSSSTTAGSATITNYRGRFFSMYGSDPLGVLSGDSCVDEGGYGVTHATCSATRVDLAHFLVGDIAEVVGTRRHVHHRTAAAGAAGGTHYDRGAAGDPTGAVTNEDYVGAHVPSSRAARRARSRRRRTMVGPESQNGLRRVRHARARSSWNFERMNELQRVRRRRATRTPATRPSSAATASRTTATSSPAARTASGSRT